jgi:hypothetical protein
VKRVIATLFSLALIALATGVTARAVQPSERGPACSDINGGGSVYRRMESTGTVTARFVLTRVEVVEPVCLKQVTYTVYVIAGGVTYSTSTANASAPPSEWSVNAFNPNRIDFKTSLPLTAPNTADVYVTTSTGVGNVNDRAPDSGFDPLTACPEGTDATGATYPPCPAPGSVYS